MSLHINAQAGEIAPSVLLPGDPLRAKWIADTFLSDVQRYNEVRGMWGFTGKYQGQAVSVQSTGMGVPSALIYCHELINEFGVKKLIRVGTAGSYQTAVKLRDVVIAMSASTTSSLLEHRFPNGQFCPTADFTLFQAALTYAQQHDLPIKAGNVLTADEFYEKNADSYKKWANYGVLAVEMETAGLYTIAAQFGVQALSVLTISDSLVTGETTTSAERESTFKGMIELALGVVVE